MMTATTWMDAGAALAQGFIDGVADPQTCPTDSAAVRTVSRKDAEAKVRLWIGITRSNREKWYKSPRRKTKLPRSCPLLIIRNRHPKRFRHTKPLAFLQTSCAGGWISSNPMTDIFGGTT